MSLFSPTLDKLKFYLNITYLKNSSAKVSEKNSNNQNLLTIRVLSQQFRYFRVGHHHVRFTLKSSLILFPEHFVRW